MNTHALKVRDSIEAIRRAMSEARQAADEVVTQRQSFQLNPALRGAKSATDAERELVEAATGAIRQARAKASESFATLGTELAAWRDKATPSGEVTDRAWSLRGAPIIAAGGSLQDVIELAIARGDRELLHGAHANGAASVVAKLGGRWSDDARRAIDAAIRSIEDAQAEHNLAEPELIEQRKQFRHAEALADEFEAATEFATKVALGTARSGDAIRLGYHEAATQRGEADAEPAVTAQDARRRDDPEEAARSGTAA